MGTDNLPQGYWSGMLMGTDDLSHGYYGVLKKGEWGSRPIGHTSILNYVGMAACGFLEI